MTLIQVAATLQGDSTLSVTAKAAYATVGALIGDANVIAVAIGIFGASTAFFGDSVVASPVSNGIRKAVGQLTGDSSITAAALFLIHLNLVGDSTFTASAKVARAAVSALTGDSNVGPIPTVVHNASALLMGAAAIVASVEAIWDARASLSGDAAIIANLMGPFELGADLQGESTVTFAATYKHAAGAVLTSEAALTAVLLKRKLAVATPLKPKSDFVDPFPGLRVNGELPIVEHSYEVIVRR